LIKIDEDGRVDIPNKVTIDRTIQEMMQDYDQLAQAMPQMHPLLVFAYGYHNYIKQVLEEIIGEDSIEIRLDLM
jgi:2-hydroxy-3-keto-5-methylthiopentenyl-1-phosphate phosphatase